MPTDFGAELTVDLAGMESLLGGLADFSLAERSRTLTLLLTVDVDLPLLDAEEFEGSTTGGFSSFDLVADRSGYRSFDLVEFALIAAGSSLMDSAMDLLYFNNSLFLAFS